MNAGGKQPPADADHPTQRNRAQSDTEPAVPEDVLVEPTVLDVACVFRDHVGGFDLADVVEDVAELDVPEALELGTVRVTLFVGERVMFAVYGHPLFGGLAGCDPKRELEQEFDCRVQGQRPVRGAPVEEDGGCHYSHLDQDCGDDQRHDQVSDHQLLRQIVLRFLSESLRYC